MKLILKSSIFALMVLIFSMIAATAQSDDVPGRDQNYELRIMLDHIFISKNADIIEVSEIVVFRNEGKEIYYTGDNHTYFAISIPAGIKNLKTDIMECCLLQEDRAVYIDPMISIKTGENFEIRISYELEPHDKKYAFNKSAMYNTTSLSLFIDKKNGVDVEGVHETVILSGREYYAIVLENLKPGDPVETALMVTSQNSDPDYFYAAAGLFILLLSVSVYHFREKLFRRAKMHFGRA